MSDLRIGISGWTYPPWRKTFFPEGLPQRSELAYAASQLNSIEINGTFYSLQRPSSYAAWYAETPAGFLFSVKCPRFITHIKRLREPRTLIANFLASGVLRLNDKLGPMLWQLPPSFAYDEPRIEAFLAELPHDTEQALGIARRHDERIKDPWTKIDRRRPLRHALEVRHQSFFSDRFLRQLRRHNVAIVVADTAGKWPLIEEVTADFAYVRLHGDEELYVSGYTPAALRSWARRVTAWRKTGDVFVYFDNDVKVRAPFDAMSLAHRLGIGPKPGKPPPVHTVKEAPRTRWPVWEALGRNKAKPKSRAKSRR